MEPELFVGYERTDLVAVNVLDLGNNEVTNIFGSDVHVAKERVLELRVGLEHLEDGRLADAHLALH